MDDGYNGNFNLVYDGRGFPHIASYTSQNLTTGLPYRFKVVAWNVNGPSIDSDIETIYSCLKPT